MVIEWNRLGPPNGHDLLPTIFWLEMNHLYQVKYRICITHTKIGIFFYDVVSVSFIKKNLGDIGVVNVVPQRQTDLWLWSFFDKTFYEDFVSSSCIGAYFAKIKLLVASCYSHKLKVWD